MFIWVAQSGWTKLHDLFMENGRWGTVWKLLFFPNSVWCCWWSKKITHFKDIRENHLQMEEVIMIFFCFGSTKIQMILQSLFLTDQRKLSIEQPGFLRYLKQSDFKDSTINEVQDESHIQSPQSCFATQRCSRWVSFFFFPGFAVLFYNLKQEV